MQEERFESHSNRDPSQPLKNKEENGIQKVKRNIISLEHTRRSSRLSNQAQVSYNLAGIDSSETVIRKKRSVKKHKRNAVSLDQQFYKPPEKRIKRVNSFGAIPGISVGMAFKCRLDASAAGVHRVPVAGIHGNPSLGCYSLVLSNKNKNEDNGDTFIYSGEGGGAYKNSSTCHFKDQVLERGNLALSLNIEKQIPVRVLRGYKLKNKYAPPQGYRYDGLYNVVDFYTEIGLSGHKTYKFKLIRVKNQEAAPWHNLPPKKHLEIEVDKKLVVLVKDLKLENKSSISSLYKSGLLALKTIPEKTVCSCSNSNKTSEKSVIVARNEKLTTQIELVKSKTKNLKTEVEKKSSSETDVINFVKKTIISKQAVKSEVSKSSDLLTKKKKPSSSQKSTFYGKKTFDHKFHTLTVKDKDKKKVLKRKNKELARGISMEPALFSQFDVMVRVQEVKK